MMIECDIMKNNKGQALVEFIIVLPIFLLLIMSVIDFGNIISKKYSLENDLDTIVDMHNKKDYTSIDTYVTNKDIKINYKNNNNLLNIELTKDVKIVSPMLVVIFGDSYEINTSRNIYE